MNQYLKTNLLFTVTFIVLFSPMCFLLINYVLTYSLPPISAKEPLSEYVLKPKPNNRSFTDSNEYADQVTVLMYHHILPENQLKKQHFTKTGELNEMVVTLEQFTEQMNFLKENHYTVLSLNEFYHFMNQELQVPEKSVLITFDDGYKSVFEFAYPVLKEHGFRAVNFIITGLIKESTVSYDSSLLQYASIEELRDSSDVFDYGNHTHSFHERTENGMSYLEFYDFDEVIKDLTKANEWLGHTFAFAAPYGEYSPTTLEILRELQMEMAFTTYPGYAQPSDHILEIQRHGIYPFYTLEDFIYIVEQQSGSF